MPPLQPSNMSDSSSTTWFSTYTKLRFFSRIRRFLNLNNSKKKQLKPSFHLDEPRNNSDANKGKMVENGMMRKDHQSDDDDDNLMVLQRAVKMLHFGSLQEKEEAVMEIGRMAKGDLKRRKLMAELGVIPPLVAMVGEEVVVEQQRVAVQALIELANGSFTNKIVMVEAGILSKIPEKVDLMDEITKQGFAQLLLSLSSIANNGFSLTSSRIIQLLVNILDSNPSIDTINLCLGTLHNLSLILDIATSLVTCATIDTLLRLSSSKEVSEKALSTLGNLVVTLTGKKALEINSRVPENLIEIMTWEDKPKCQELCAYILMILAHQSYIQRAKMSKAGIVPVLLEVALLGSPLAQKRALKLLQWFKDERQVRIGPHSGPQRMIISSQLSSSPSKVDDDQGKKVMKSIVKQSLYKNMERISSRANGGGGGDASRFKALAESSSSKSLPY